MHDPLRLGIDLGGTKIEAQLLSGHTTIWRHRIPTPAGDYAATLNAVLALVEQARSVAGTSCSVGLGTPGSLTPDGLLKNANSTCLNGQALQRDIEALLGQPVRIANDANCLALSESTDGAAAGAECVFAAILGTGVGAGLSVRGQLLTGPNGLAGEWGHNALPWPEAPELPGDPCYCGRRGCIETWLSGPGLARDHLRSGGQPMSAIEIGQRAGSGDAACQASLDRYTLRLAKALASVINVLDPDVIVLGGGLSKLPQIYDRVPALWPRWIFSGGLKDPVRTRLLPALHGDASGVRGAARLWNRAPLTSRP